MNYNEPIAEVSFFQEVVGNSKWESEIDPDEGAENNG